MSEFCPITYTYDATALRADSSPPTIETIPSFEAPVFDGILLKDKYMLKSEYLRLPGTYNLTITGTALGNLVTKEIKITINLTKNCEIS